MSKFYRGIWRHSDDRCSLDMKVINVIHVNDERTKLKIMYVSKSSDNLQYTGKGKDGYSDTVRVQKSDYNNWRIVDE